jgi:hypothetical protein
MLHEVQAEVGLYGLSPEYGSFLINIANYASVASSGEGVEGNQTTIPPPNFGKNKKKKNYLFRTLIPNIKIIFKKYSFFLWRHYISRAYFINGLNVSLCANFLTKIWAAVVLLSRNFEEEQHSHYGIKIFSCNKK